MANKINKSAKKSSPTVLTPSQVKTASAKANTLLRGIDNTANQVQKASDQINKKIDAMSASVDQLTGLLRGLSNSASQVKAVEVKTVKPKQVSNTKPSKVEKVKPAKVEKAKPAKVKPAKVEKAKPAKVSKPAKAEKPKVEKAKPAKEASPAAEKAVDNRPALKSVIDEILNKEASSIKVADLYNTIIKGYGTWSRQSFYNAIKDSKYQKTSDGAVFLASHPPVVVAEVAAEDDNEEEAEKIIRKMANSADQVASVL